MEATTKTRPDAVQHSSTLLCQRYLESATKVYIIVLDNRWRYWNVFFSVLFVRPSQARICYGEGCPSSKGSCQ